MALYNLGKVEKGFISSKDCHVWKLKQLFILSFYCHYSVIHWQDLLKWCSINPITYLEQNLTIVDVQTSSPTFSSGLDLL